DYENAWQVKIDERNSLFYPKEILCLKHLTPVKEVVRMLDYFRNDTFAYIVMKPIPNVIDLKIYSIKMNGLDESLDVQNIFGNLVQAVVRVWQLHIVHRDLKPQNILLNELTKEVYLIDFGSATFFPGDREEPYLANENWYFTPLYLPPEMFLWPKGRVV